MLTRVYIDNYKCFTNFEWRPEPLALIAGRNGSGKSALLEVLGAVREVITEPGPELPEAFQSSRRTRWDARPTQKVELTFKVAESEHQYALVVDHSNDKGPRVVSESLRTNSRPVYAFQDGVARLFQEDGSTANTLRTNKSQSFLTLLDDGNNPALTSFRGAIWNLWHVSPDPRQVEEASASEAGYLVPRMSNFVSWYRTLLSSPARLRRIETSLSEALPGFVGLGLQPPVGKLKRLVASFAQDFQRRDVKPLELDFQELSDGQRMLIMLYTLLEVVPFGEGATLIIDEPDNFLGLMEIQPWLRSLEDRLDGEGGQAFVISHHPEVLNRLWPTHAVHFVREPFGPTRVHEAALNSELSAAELWARGWEEEAP